MICQDWLGTSIRRVETQSRSVGNVNRRVLFRDDLVGAFDLLDPFQAIPVRPRYVLLLAPANTTLELPNQAPDCIQQYENCPSSAPLVPPICDLAASLLSLSLSFSQGITPGLAKLRCLEICTNDLRPEMPGSASIIKFFGTSARSTRVIHTGAATLACALWRFSAR